MNGTIKFFWFLTFLATICATGIAILGIQRATNAIQEIDAFAFALAITIIPYCLARSIEKLGS